MGNPSKNIAILFFSRSAPAESRHKKFVSGSQKNSRIAQSLITHSFRQAKQSGFPVFHIDEQQQRGATFGERFTNAFQQIFERGYDYVISVGNDIPQMQSHHINNAARQLFSGQADMVLGPDTDGGTWLMGYSREAFSADHFRELPWNTDHLLDTILEQRTETNIQQLELLSDIDGEQAFQQFLRGGWISLSLTALVRQLRNILVELTIPQSTITLSIQQLLSHRANLLRAPPLK